MKLRHRAYLVEASGNSTVVATKELPASLQQALKKVGFRRKDIRVCPATSTSVRSSAGDGSRGFTMAVNMATGQMSDVSVGSWGGQNPFKKEPIDWMDKPVNIPTNGAIINGTTGGHGTFATIYIHPDSLAPLLPGETDITEREKKILSYAGYKSAYKKEKFLRNNVTKGEILSLVARGYMKMNKAGSTSLTPKGKNARPVNWTSIH